jgi:hypothetical protein
MTTLGDILEESLKRMPPPKRVVRYQVYRPATSGALVAIGSPRTAEEIENIYGISISPALASIMSDGTIFARHDAADTLIYIRKATSVYA